MSDVMLFGVLKMPYEMAMATELSRFQFYQRVQELVERVESQPERTWVGLTDEDIQRCLDVADGSMGRLLSAIEAKLKEKNNG